MKTGNFTAMDPRVKHFACFILLLLAYSCSERSGGAQKFAYEQEAYPDTVTRWLADRGNYGDGRFTGIWQEYYRKKLAQGDLAAATRGLEAGAEYEMYNYSFRPATVEAIRSFRKAYSAKIPWTATLFIDSYLGNYHLDAGEYMLAMPYFRHIMRFEPVDYNSCREIGYAHSDLAFCYSGVGDQEKALQENLRALDYFNRIDNPTARGGAYDNIALVHMFTKNYLEAEKSFDRALEYYKEAGDTVNIFTTLHNKVLLYDEMSHPQKFRLIDSVYGLFIGSGLDDPSMEVSLSGLYVEKLLHERRTAEAKAILDKMRIDAAQLGSPAADADFYISLAEYALSTGEGLENTAEMDKALKAVEEGGHFQNQLAFAEVLKENSELKGDYKRALFYAEKEREAAEKLSGREMIAKTAELNNRFETVKKEQQIERQERTIVNRNGAIALLGALLAVFVLVFFTVQLRKKQRAIQEERRRSVRFTRQLLRKTEDERKRIAGDLHDSVSHELLTLKNSLGSENPEAGEKIAHIINDIRVISRNLHPIMFEKVGLAASVEQLVDRAQSVHDLMVTADIGYDGSLSTGDELQVYRIIQEALSNTVKYAEAVAAKITLLSKSDGLHIELKDNGKGFSVSERLADGKAFGLHNILERSRAIGGFARIASDGNGTVITIDIKKQ
jgi:two-component system, NarL family, sensor kinase